MALSEAHGAMTYDNRSRGVQGPDFTSGIFDNLSMSVAMQCNLGCSFMQGVERSQYRVAAVVQ